MDGASAYRDGAGSDITGGVKDDLTSHIRVDALDSGYSIRREAEIRHDFKEYEMTDGVKGIYKIIEDDDDVAVEGFCVLEAVYKALEVPCR